MKGMTSYKLLGVCDVSKQILDARNLSILNWQEISVPEVITVNKVKIEDINEVNISVKIDSVKLVETPFSSKNYQVALLDSDGNVVYVDGIVQTCDCCKVFTIEENSEGTCLSGRKLVVEGRLKQKIIYTADTTLQSVHSIEVEYPFSTYIIAYANFSNTTGLLGQIVVIDPLDDTKTITIEGYLYHHNNPIEVNMCEEFCVNVCVEDVYVKLLDNSTIFKNVTLFISAKPKTVC